VSHEDHHEHSDITTDRRIVSSGVAIKTDFY